MLTIRISRRVAFSLVLGVLLVIPAVSWASHTFTDVPDSNIFHEDIAWLADAEVTKGCNPPDNTEFCPDNAVTRAQMAAFMRRFAQYLNAEDGTPGYADTAGTAETADDADTVDGQDATAFLGVGAKAADADRLDGLHASALAAFAVGAEQVGAQFLTGTPAPVITLDVTAPSDGQVTLNSSALVYHTGAGGDVACFILRSTDPTPAIVPSTPGIQGFEADGASIDNGTLAGTRVFDVSARTTTTFELRCGEADGDGGRVEARGLTAIFTPGPVS